MTDQSNDNVEIRQRVKDLPPVEAGAAFRDRLRSAFAEGRLDAPPQADAPEAAPVRPTARPGATWWRWLAPVAVAAAVVITMLAVNRSPHLSVLEVAGTGEVRVDGRAVSLDDPDAINAGLHAGAVIETPAGARVDLLSRNTLLLEVAGGTRMSIPSSPGRWFARAVQCSLSVGEVRIKTGDRFSGGELVVHTPDGRVRVTGTLLSIQSDAAGTCVCVLEGTALVGVDEGDMEPVPPGSRKVMMRDGTKEIIPVKDMHRDGVLDFDNRVGGRMTGD